MVLKRVIVICSISMLMGGCSHLLIGPGHYASLPPVSGPERVGDTPRISEVVIPGTLTTQPSSAPGRGVNPLAVLQRSVSVKADQESLRVGKPTERHLLTNRSEKAGLSPSTLEPTSTASLQALDKGAAQYPTENYDREATMNRLMKGGQEAAKSICNGC
jgi:hypothetical protein